LVWCCAWGCWGRPQGASVGGRVSRPPDPDLVAAVDPGQGHGLIGAEPHPEARGAPDAPPLADQAFVVGKALKALTQVSASTPPGALSAWSHRAATHGCTQSSASCPGWPLPSLDGIHRDRQPREALARLSEISASRLNTLGRKRRFSNGISTSCCLRGAGRSAPAPGPQASRGRSAAPRARRSPMPAREDHSWGWRGVHGLMEPGPPGEGRAPVDEPLFL